MAYRLFIFDFDGTLADSGPMMFDILNRAAIRFRFRQISEAELYRYRSVETRIVLRELGIRRWRLPQIARWFRHRAREQPSPPLFPGIVDTLHALHARGIVLAVVSSNSEAAVRRALGPENTRLFQCFACSASVFGKARKFRRVLRSLHVNRADAIAIGDECRDIAAARKAGVDCAAVSWGYADPSLLAANRPDIMIERLEDILELATGEGTRLSSCDALGSDAAIPAEIRA